MDLRVDEFEKILAGKNRPEMDQKLLPLLQLTPSLADYVQKNEKFVDRVCELGSHYQWWCKKNYEFWVEFFSFF